ncbi:MAG: FG-GAP-like repeat-containing protein [Sulfurovum sp.]|nr:FG-GAP-like repeat-containing protein [Sulfurovum sp.]
MKFSILYVLLLSLFFTGCEVGITPLEKKFNDAGVATSGVVSEDGDIGPITVEVQEGVDVDDLNVSVEIFGEGSEHFTVSMDKTASAYIGEVNVKEPKPIFYHDTPFTFSARTIVNGQKLCAKEVQKTVPKTEVAPEAFDMNATLKDNVSISFDLNATDKNDDVLTYIFENSTTTYGSVTNEGKTVTYRYNNSKTRPTKDTFRYKAKDTTSKESEWASVTIHFKDKTAPTITLLGKNPINLIVGTTYTDAGATATDKIDGNITESITDAIVFEFGDKVTDVQEINTTEIGTYTITYNVKDSAGNSATPVTRTVKVISDDIGFDKRMISENPLEGKITELELADFDGDGDLDIFALYSKGDNGIIQYYENKDNGKYNASKSINVGDIKTMHTADLDGDEKVELLFALEEKVLVYQNINGSLEENATLSKNFASGDIMTIDTGYIVNDAKLDIAVTTSSPKLKYPMTFSRIGNNELEYNATSLVLGDKKAGAINAFMAKENNTVVKVKLSNLGTQIGSVEEISSGKNIKSLSLADLDGDDSNESLIMTANNSGGIYILNIKDNNTTKLSSLLSPTHATGADIDGDGKIDIHSANGESNGTYWYRNMGNMKFKKKLIDETIMNPTITKAGDMDDDGNMDVVVGDIKGTIYIFTNQTTVKVNKVVSVGDRSGDFTRTSMGQTQ